MSASKSYDAFANVDKVVSKPVLGSDGAASWQEFRKDVKQLQHESTAPALQVKRVDRLATGFGTLADERAHEQKVRADAGDSSLGAGYTNFKRKNDAGDAAERKKRKRIEKKLRPDDKAYFVTSKMFQGWKFDYVFTTRGGTTGYYWDGTDSLEQLNSGVSKGDEEQNKTEQSRGSNQEEAEAKSTAKKKAKKKKKPEATTVPVAVENSSSMNPMEQVAAALRRRQEALRAPPISDVLPTGWEKATDKGSGKVYYFHREKGQRQWDKPTALPPNWQAAQDKTGKTYYYNATTGETKWEKPTN